MFLNKCKKGKTYLFCLGLFIVFLSGCNNNENATVNNYYLSLMGESENWKVESYDVKITPDMFKTGNGTVIMKTHSEYKTDFFSIRVHAIIDNKDKVILGKSVSSNVEVNVAKETTGTTEGGAYVTEDGKPITLDNISNIYMIIKWQDVSNEETLEERIELFNKNRFSLS